MGLVRGALIRCVDWGCVRAEEEFAQRSLMMILNMLFLNIIQPLHNFPDNSAGAFCAGISTACGFLAYDAHTVWARHESEFM